jgi:hypothetical protein
MEVDALLHLVERDEQRSVLGRVEEPQRSGVPQQQSLAAGKVDRPETVPRITPWTVAPRVSVGDAASCDADPAPDATPVGSIALARPKSRTLTFPSGVTLTFCGLRSR